MIANSNLLFIINIMKKDLITMPHLLIRGSRGSGKNLVCKLITGFDIYDYRDIEYFDE